MKRTKRTLLLSAFLCTVLLPLKGYAQGSDEPHDESWGWQVWAYLTPAGIYQAGDSIKGWYAAFVVTGSFAGGAERKMNIGGKTYAILDVQPAYLPTARRSEAAGEYNDADYYIGIRREGSRVLVNRDNYLRLVGERSMPFVDYYGDATYIPYPATEDGLELILYDYDMKPGDTYAHVDGHDDIAVASKDMVTLGDGKPHRRLVLTNGLELIEGVGCTNSPGLLLCYLNPDKDNMAETVLAYSENTAGRFYSIPFSIVYEDGVDVSSIGTPDTTSPCYDLYGRRLRSHPAKGIYVENGRKRVVRQ